MYNLAVSLDPAIVREARILAAGEGMTLDAKVNEFLQQYAKFGSVALEAMKLQVNDSHRFADFKA
jgi:hypothetical protein